MTAEKVKFHFDPRCPWCYMTSRWAVRLEELGRIEIEWALFSLDIVNAPVGTIMTAENARSGTALCTVIALRNEGYGHLVGDFYTAIGKRIWEQAPPQEMPVAVRGALEEIGVDPSLCDKAIADPSTWQTVVDEQHLFVTTTRSFGVPSIVLDGGKGPAIFGPIVSRLPNDKDAVELWEHVSWLARYDNFSELKRDRTSRPDLPAVKWRIEQQNSAKQ